MNDETKTLLAEIKGFPREVQLAFVEFIDASLIWDKRPEQCELNRLFNLRIEELRQGNVGASAALHQLYSI